MDTQLDAELRANILVEALPYIQEYYGQTVVVKYGGNAMINEELKDAVIHDLVLLNLVGVKVVIVHGGGPEINEMLGKIGKESKFVNGLRYTDRETMDIVQMVLCGKVNKDLVTLLEKAGGRGIGLGGMDGGLFQAKRLTDRAGTDYGYVGDIMDVDRHQCVAAGIIPAGPLHRHRRRNQLQYQRRHRSQQAGSALGERS
ncbi:MAG: hypothetical protein ACLT4C_05300 [Butyricicoccus sp.]